MYWTQVLSLLFDHRYIIGCHMVSVETTVIKMSFQLVSMKLKNPKRKESDLNSVLVNRCVYIQRFPVYLCRGWDGVASLCCLSSFLKIKATCKSRRYLKTHYDTCLLGDAKCLVFHFFFFLIRGIPPSQMCLQQHLQMFHYGWLSKGILIYKPSNSLKK